MNKKWTLILAVCLISVLIIAGCTRNTATPSPSPMLSPMTSPLSTADLSASPLPQTTPDTSPMTSPGTSPETSPGNATDNGDQAKMADDIAKEVEKLSEISTASVVIHEKTALIGVEFDAAYRGSIDDRLTKMIEEKAQAVDSNIDEVVVTDDKAIMDEIEDMRAKVSSGDALADLKADFDSLINRIKPKV